MEILHFDIATKKTLYDEFVLVIPPYGIDGNHEAESAIDVHRQLTQWAGISASCDSLLALETEDLRFGLSLEIRVGDMKPQLSI